MIDFDIPTILARYDQREEEILRTLENAKRSQSERVYQDVLRAYARELSGIQTRRQLLSSSHFRTW